VSSGRGRLARAWLLAALLLAPAPGRLPAGAAEPARPSRVIVLSWDGMRHDHPDRGELPALARMRRDGARAARLVPPFPSNTFPSHVSLATGTHPDRHGIVNNSFRDPARGRFDYSNDASWIDAEPLWVAAERQGVRSAVFFWVGSETDWRGRGPSHRVAPFDASVGEAEKVDRLLAWLDLPEAERPRLLMAWWHGPDAPGHRYGPDSAEVDRQLAAQDAQLARLLAGLDDRGLWETTTLLLVSDHGMTPAGRVLDARQALADAGVAADVETGGGVAFVYLRAADALGAARRALAALPGVAVYAPGEAPARLRAGFGPRGGDLLLLAQPPGRFARAGDGVLARLVQRWIAPLASGAPGGHGYDPEHADMGAAFLALGRGVPAGARLGDVHAVDVAPSVAALLGIEPPRDSEGRALLGRFAEAAR
jgi:arylsulfatase A-like enzyme